ncbi:choline phosphate cytidylyltransferase [Binucleata daphniae]
MKVFIDGCFDLFHYGHANALRQAKDLGSHLTAGVCSTITTKKYKNTPIMTDLERYEVLNACKFVDVVVNDAPYFLDMELVKSLGCELVVHGDDEIIDTTGNDCYGTAKKLNQFKQFNRTLGISTSEIVGRMIYREEKKKKLSHEIETYHKKLMKEFANDKYSTNNIDKTINNKIISEHNKNNECYTKLNNTTNLINQHVNNTNSVLKNERLVYETKEDNLASKVIYIDGTFDLYHAGHTTIIKEAKQRGDKLIVGLHGDDEIYKQKGEEPIMRYNERKLCLLSNKHIDKIIDYAPYKPNKDFLADNLIDEIVIGKAKQGLLDYNNVYAYEHKFSYLNVETVCRRIMCNFNEYIAKAEKIQKQ